MNPTTKKRVIIGVSVLTILSVGGYFAWKKIKERRDAKKAEQDAALAEAERGKTTNFGTTPSSNSQATAEQTALAVAYRVWANSTDELSKKYGKKSQYDLDATSSTPYNSFFLKSYEAGKADYEKSKSSGSSTLSQSILNDIATIRSKANKNSPKAGETYLKSVAISNPSYVQNWAYALRNNSTTFLFANQIYDSVNGIRIYDSNPYSANNWYPKSSGKILKANPTDDSAAEWAGTNTQLGKVRALKYTSEGLWFYLPDYSSIYKWTKAAWVKNTKN